MTQFARTNSTQAASIPMIWQIDDSGIGRRTIVVAGVSGGRVAVILTATRAKTGLRERWLDADVSLSGSS